jgi:hypothetical protein
MQHRWSFAVVIALAGAISAPSALAQSAGNLSIEVVANVGHAASVTTTAFSPDGRLL